MQERYELSIRTAEIALGEKKWNQVSGILSGVSPCSEAYYPKRKTHQTACISQVFKGGIEENVMVWFIMG